MKNTRHEISNQEAIEYMFRVEVWSRNSDEPPRCVIADNHAKESIEAHEEFEPLDATMRRTRRLTPGLLVYSYGATEAMYSAARNSPLRALGAAVIGALGARITYKQLMREATN